MSCPNCGREVRDASDLGSHGEYCLLAVLLGVLLDRGHDLSGLDVERIDADTLWQAYGGPAADFVAEQLGLDPDPPQTTARHGFPPEPGSGSFEHRAMDLLNAAGIDAHLHHTGGGIWVCEVPVSSSPECLLWISGSEGDPGGEFYVGAYPTWDSEMIEALSGACEESQVVASVRRALAAAPFEGA